MRGRERNPEKLGNRAMRAEKEGREKRMPSPKKEDRKENRLVCDL